MTDQTPIKTPFAAEGDKATILDESTSSVNWKTGFTPNYSKKLTEEGAKLVSRKDLNGILNSFAKAIRYIQIGGTAFWNSTFAKAGGGSEFQQGSIIWKKKDGYWFILEAKADSPRNPDTNSGDWNWNTLAQYVDQKMKLDKVVATELSVGGMTLKSGAAQGCPTPVNSTDFANKQYVDGAVNRILIGSDTTARKQSINANTEYPVQASDSGKLLIITTQAQRESYARIQIYSESIGTWLDVSGSTSFDQSMSIHTFSCYCKAGLKFKVVAGKTPFNTYAYYIG